MSNNQNKITPLGLVVAVLIIVILAALAVPRLREVSYENNISESPKILATFGADVSAGGGEGVAVICKACDGTPTR